MKNERKKFFLVVGTQKCGRQTLMVGVQEGSVKKRGGGYFRNIGGGGKKYDPFGVTGKVSFFFVGVLNVGDTDHKNRP